MAVKAYEQREIFLKLSVLTCCVWGHRKILAFYWSIKLFWCYNSNSVTQLGPGLIYLFKHYHRGISLGLWPKNNGGVENRVLAHQSLFIVYESYFTKTVAKSTTTFLSVKKMFEIFFSVKMTEVDLDHSYRRPSIFKMASSEKKSMSLSST